ncbi:F-box/kelch-repeat protein [Sesamum alatum]|uniref:F-box/kelch-repeat protein n=1 Tax=Sesamum alatum TaxID=300844 RepID=A0AAE2CKS9_9LAMI|nr:F-box/kelch-repeat protein [Sesamum alatum]
MEAGDLPREILIDIFSRLPPKSVGKCRCLAKIWRQQLSTPHFIKSHLTRKTRQENLILITPSHSIHSISTIKDDAISRKLELPGNWTEVVGSCDGMVLLVNEDHEKFLVNPITLQQVQLPNSPQALNRMESFSMHGFGYDSSSDDYKVVTLSYYDTDNEYEPDCVDTFVDVYSVKRGVWKRVNSSPYDHAVPEPSPGAFVNGAIHWLASSREPGYPSVIAAFNLVDEVFDEIPAPSSVDVQNFVFNKLVTLGDCLCLIDARGNGPTNVWIMKEYGLKESWTKFSINGDYEWDIVKPLCLIGDEEVVLVTEGETLVVYNRTSGTLRDMVVDGGPASAIDGGTFLESLVSPASIGA